MPLSGWSAAAAALADPVPVAPPFDWSPIPGLATSCAAVSVSACSVASARCTPLKPIHVVHEHAGHASTAVRTVSILQHEDRTAKELRTQRRRKVRSGAGVKHTSSSGNKGLEQLAALSLKHRLLSGLDSCAAVGTYAGLCAGSDQLRVSLRFGINNFYVRQTRAQA